MKKVCVWIMVLTMVFLLCACGLKTEDVSGMWQRETVYLSYYACDADLYLVLAEGDEYNEYLEVLLNHNTGDLLDLNSGLWDIIDGEVVTVEEGDEGAVTAYQYQDGALKNGDLEFAKIGTAEDFSELLGNS